jgi:undecaprenyl-diphosphatase
VVCLYWKRFFKFDNTPAPEGSTLWQRLKHKYHFYWLLIVGVLPAIVIGLAAKKSGLLDWMLDSVLVVAIMLVVGGVFMLYCDRLFNKGSEANKVTEKRAFRIGLFQCISVIPGVSRSMATIVGGMAQGLTRQRAAEFSFFLAVPTMAGATLLDLLDLLKEDASWATTHNITMLILGCVVAFIVALLAMKWFVAFLSKYGFKAFGVYRIIVGGIILVMLLTGHSLTMVD